MSYLDRVHAARDFDRRRFLPFSVEGRHCGWVRPAFASLLQRWPEVFAVAPDRVEIVHSLATPAARSEAVAPVLRALRDEGVIAGWRNEIYPVAADFGDLPLLRIERAAARAFGIRTRGAHLNGVIGAGDQCQMWIARRAATKPIDPAMLDNLVGGGVALGMSPLDTILKECGEEAGIAPEYGEFVQARSTVSLLREVPEGVQWENLYTFDLEVPSYFQPVNHDGEVVEFRLLPVRDVRHLVRDSAEFTVDAALVILDFLLRNQMSGTASAELLALAEAMREPPVVQPW
jgi:8-oxo-dGTP pyrophosphatase MutT (NUDIX family)